MRARTPFTVILIRYLIILALLATGAYLGYEALLYNETRGLLPAGMIIAELPVAGLTVEEAGTKVEETYYAPFILTHRGEQVELDPRQAEFQVELDVMLTEAQKHLNSLSWRDGFIMHLLDGRLDPLTIKLVANHNPQKLRELVQLAGDVSDIEVQQPTLISGSFKVESGESGWVTDVEASLPGATEVLYKHSERISPLVVTEVFPEEPGINVLQAALEDQTVVFDGIASIFVKDLQTGEEVSINGTMAMSGISVMKIAIMMEAYRAYDYVPLPYEFELFEQTAAQSSDLAANLLLDVVAGQDNAYLGVDILTESMQRLGLVNTFIATPYQEPSRPGRESYVTEANTSLDAIGDLDPAMQTTVEEMGTLVADIYYCTQDQGALRAVYPESVLPEECQALLDVMGTNIEGNLFRFGVPHGTRVDHKHGWAGGTHADAGIIYTPGGNYAIVAYLYQPGGWLVADYSFPFFYEISRTVYNYFNPEAPYLGDPLEEPERFAEIEAARGELQSGTESPEIEPEVESQ